MTVPELQNKEQGAQSSPFDSEHRPLGGFVEVFDMCSTLLSPTWKWKGKRGKLHCGMSEQRTLRGGLLGSRKRRVGAHLILKGGGENEDRCVCDLPGLHFRGKCVAWP